MSPSLSAQLNNWPATFDKVEEAVDSARRRAGFVLGCEVSRFTASLVLVAITVFLPGMAVVFLAAGFTLAGAFCFVALVPPDFGLVMGFVSRYMRTISNCS